MDSGSCTMEEELQPSRSAENKATGRNHLQVITSKCKTICQRLYKIVSSSIGLLLLLAVYSFIGALIIQAIEEPEEKANHETIRQHRKVVVDMLTNLSTDYMNGHINRTRWLLSHDAVIASYEQQLGVTTQPKWTFWGALFFCGTIYTTIGYGHIAPSTSAGRVATMIYAAFGIPLALVVLAALGRRLTVGIKFLWSYVRHFYYTRWRKLCYRKGTYNLKKSPRHHDGIVAEGNPLNGTDIEQPKPNDDDPPEDYEIDAEFNLPIIVAISIVFVYIIIGSFMYLLWERNWDFLKSFYFIFISISTIGFGDILPEHPKFFILSSIYIFIGLSLVSMCVNVAIEFFAITIDKAKEKVDQAKDKAMEKIEVVGNALDRAKDLGMEKMQEVGDKLDKCKTKVTAKSKRMKYSQDGEDLPLDEDC